MIRGLFLILFFYFIGVIISELISNLIPGSVIGMILLFAALYFKIVKPENVKGAATVITKNMAVFFVPAAVGLMAYAEIVSKSFWIITLAISISTILTIVTVAIIQEKMEKNKNGIK